MGRWGRRLAALARNSPLADRPDFRRLCAASVFAGAGMAGEQVLLGLLAYRIAGSSAWVGIVLAVYFLPFFVVGALSGAIADRFDRRRLLAGLEAGLAAALALAAAGAWAGLEGPAAILAASAALGALRATSQPVRVSYAYDLAGGERAVAALGMLNLGARAGQLAGALAAGAAMESAGAGPAFLALAAGHVGALLLSLRLREPGRAAVAAAERVPIRRNLAEYAWELRRNRMLLALVLLTASVELFGFSYFAGLPELAEGRLAVGAEGLGWLHAARAAGGMAAGLVLSLGLGALARPARVYPGVIVVFGAGLLAAAAAGSLAAVLAALFVVAAMATASDVLTQAMLQLSVPNALRGRAMGAWTLAVGVSPAGQLEMGFLVGALGLGGAFAANGAALAAVGLAAALFLPRLRRL